MTSPSEQRGSAGQPLRAPGASRRWPSVLLALTIGAAALIADLASKAWAERTLALGETRPLVGDLLQLRLIYNSGAAFSLGSSVTPIITVVQILICVAVLGWVLVKLADWRWAIALGLLAGGALGNIHDRLLRAPKPLYGEVVDFLELPHWPIFNIADTAVVTAAVLIVLLTLFGVTSDGSVLEKDADGSSGAATGEDSAPSGCTADGEEVR
ncbi:signal peptidase II [Helcobacillus massiliensis]|uniref:signal peptidase II n=1 Tax=Helcobacillus massiliensis TaxID=521392 RepID=UPI0025538952|nr:signal peptidase II [Helcobacillus massiliensis]MDK7742510.1 signal peptidase II [Helcobacillus massiliensis]WOO93367.1 signal peptidase II [Helcobacillus massiliensis]